MIATALVFGGVQAFGRLREQRLLALGMPTEPDPVVWFAALGVVGFVTGALVLSALEGRIERAGAPDVAYVSATLAGVVGLLLVAHVGNVIPGIIGTVLVMGVADPLVRTSATIAVNRRIEGNVRATVHSLLWQSAHVGTIIFGLSLAAIASGSPSASLTAAALLLIAAALLVAQERER